MLIAYRAKLHDFPRLRARWTCWPYGIGHVAIIHKLNELRLRVAVRRGGHVRGRELGLMLAGLCESS
jgi:hypothetical protein